MEATTDKTQAANLVSRPPMIWRYSDYRVYLNDFVTWKKSENSKFSYAYFAKALGTTKSYLKLVVSQQRNVSLDKIVRISMLLEHNHFERQYFLFLYLENSTDEPEMKAYFKTILNGFCPEGRPRNQVIEPQEDKKFEAMRNWVMLSIAGLAACRGYKHQCEWIHQKLGGDAVVSRHQVQEAMEALVRCGVIQNSDEACNLSVESECRSANVFDMDQLQAYKTGLTRCLLAVDLWGRSVVHDPKKFFMNIIAVNKEDQKKVMDLFEEFEKKLWTITHASPEPDQVMLISNNVITLNGDKA